jgi:hypothetical protein
MDIREISLRKSIPVVINSFNQLYYLKNIIEKLLSAGFCNLYVFDNASTYPPLLSYLEEVQSDPRVLVIYYGANLGPHYFFLSELYRGLFPGDIFIYTDPDLDWDSLADNYVCRLLDLTNKFQTFKVGSALEIPQPSELKGNLPMHWYEGNSYTLLEWECRYWVNEFEPGVYSAPIDTTLHLFNSKYYVPGEPIITGLRCAGEGFTCRHIPWMKRDAIPIEELNFYQALEKHSNWVKS